ncbi:MAG: hypothetical protein COW67_11065 [Flavobacteriales bacterium CG18_big_fil_WC_8_21_14_2_50_32_9]|nr:MAG: hypothetical protein COW67_11065 [Flavobacteriales bacterium CG18_big_fil_WC_8_21_14_2_50_32_9]PJC61919.1 MAG: hypothetical protein CO022_07320 [Flavobacteriales bacterium CG_4_9_14_0_2_um_filter_32_27]
MRKLILLLFFIVSGLTAFSQSKIKQFSSDSTIFFNEMEEFLRASRAEDGKLVMDEFSWTWFGGKFSENQRESVYVMANLMLNNKKKAFPDFSNYIKTISLFVNSKYQTETSFFSWQAILEKLIKGETQSKSSSAKKQFVDYLQACNALFEENALFKSPSNTWKANNSNYKFGFDSIPTIEFDALTLTCYSKGDSAIIFNTKGKFYPTEQIWYGEGGKITWERAGFPADSVFATINSTYQINVKSPSFEINEVTFYDYYYFDQALDGSLSEKILANITEEKATYPRFTSSNARLQIKNIIEDVDYIGGFSLHGYKVLGTGVDNQDAYVIFYRKKLPFVKMSAKAFVIRPDRIVSNDASFTMYLKQDSIYHPGLIFKFFFDERKLNLIRDNQGIKKTPYLNSYHKVDMNFEYLTWAIDSPMVQFRNLVGGTKTDATFVSTDFFRKDAYMSFLGSNTIHPLYMVKSLVDKLDTNFITMYQLAEHSKYSKSQLENFLLGLSYQGFVKYDYDTKTFVVEDKLITWVKASGGRVDYDVIGFYSNIEKANNATLSLLNYDMLMRGVKQINLSDSQEVKIFPKNQTITLKKNRDFDFSGTIQAGRFDFMGHDFKFKYDDFKIDMPIVDSVRIYAETPQKDEYGNPIIRPVKTVVQQVNGDLLIDKPNNKSGVKPYSEYPIFHSFKDSYVYYDRNSIQGGVYGKEDFYFQVKPFTIDSLADFDNSALRFDGTLVSAGIFQDIEETLTLQPDHSLGFVKKTPPEGMPVYAGKGKFNNDIKLSHQGLKGDGDLVYVASTTYSNNFIFFPDSMNAVAQRFTVKENSKAIEFPPAEGENVFTRWFPKKDYMIHKEIDKPIAMYDMKSKMHGSTIMAPDGLSGVGVFEFEKAEMESNLIKFKFQDFSADTADFRLKDSFGDGDALAFSTKNVNAFVSFKERNGLFKSNGDGSVINFEPMKYICFMDEFKWFMDNDDIELSAGTQQAQDASGVSLDGAQFISVHPEQDSLSFFSTKARYDIRNKVIYADGVKFMNIADVMLYPDSGKVIIDKNASMRTLNNSRIVASYITQNHNIYNATTNVFGKRKYAGSGYVDYVDEIEKSQTIYLASIGVDTTGQTIANAEIKPEDDFTLSPRYKFYGKVALNANNQFLTFKGNSKIFHDCDLLGNNWFTFNSIIDPNEIYIPIDSNTKDENGNKLIASILLSSDSLGIYSSFLNQKKKNSHKEVIPTKGFLYFDKVSEEYRISNKDKLQEISFGGNYLSLSTKNCKIYGEGKIDLGAESGQLTIESAGVVYHNQLDNEAIFDLVLSMDFFFADDAMKNMTKKLEQASDLEPVKLDRPTFEKGIKEIIGKDEGDKIIAQVNLYGSYKKMPDIMRKTILFNEIKFKWNQANKSYRSYGKIGISNLGKDQINKYVEGKIEIIKKRSGDIINIYLEVDKNNWYFFSYTRGIMQSISSDSDFNTVIQETKPDKRKAKQEKGQEPYQFMYSSDKKKRDFIRSFDE